jgi:hypothetical protein
MSQDNDLGSPACALFEVLVQLDEDDGSLETGTGAIPEPQYEDTIGVICGVPLMPQVHITATSAVPTGRSIPSSSEVNHVKVEVAKKRENASPPKVKLEPLLSSTADPVAEKMRWRLVSGTYVSCMVVLVVHYHWSTAITIQSHR